MAQNMVRLTRVLGDAEKEWKLLRRTVKRIDQVQYSTEILEKYERFSSLERNIRNTLETYEQFEKS